MKRNMFWFWHPSTELGFVHFTDNRELDNEYLVTWSYNWTKTCESFLRCSCMQRKIKKSIQLNWVVFRLLQNWVVADKTNEHRYKDPIRENDSSAFVNKALAYCWTQNRCTGDISSHLTAVRRIYGRRRDDEQTGFPKAKNRWLQHDDGACLLLFGRIALHLKIDAARTSTGGRCRVIRIWSVAASVHSGYCFSR